MIQYIKRFKTHDKYQEYINDKDRILPNVSYCENENEVHYNVYCDVIRYAASAKLAETTSSYGSGLHTNAFNTTITSHTFENGVGVIKFADNVSSIGNSAFYNCYNLTNITIPNSVTSIGKSAFQSCVNLTNVTMGTGVTSIGNYAFYGCTTLTDITIPNSVTTIGASAFYGCSGLTSITIPNSVTSIGDYAFNSCSKLTSATIGSGVTTIGDYAFGYCSQLATITVDSNNSTFDSRNNCNAIISTSNNVLIVGCKNTVIPNTVTTIGAYAFNGCSGLTSITIPNSVTYIGECGFHKCTGLTSVAIGTGLTSLGNASFKNCTALTSITIPNNVTSIGHSVFDSCTKLASITSLATTAPTITSSTFQNVKTGGTLYVPTGSDYSVWMGTGNYYLGKYNWTNVQQ